MEADALPRRPRAEAYSVQQLVDDALRGRLRVPDFQRGLKWTSEDVRALFDSIFRGYPIGSLLMWRRPAVDDGPVRLGPHVIPDPDTADVRWIVDGQQRVTALALSLSGSPTRDERFDIWFDARSQTFHTRPRGTPEPTWVPVRELLDAADLGEFAHDWAPGREDRELRRVLFEAGKRIREYAVPAYVIEAEDDGVLREIFRRVNRSGHPLDEAEVFNAIVRDRSTDARGLDIVASAVENLGWGDLKESTLLNAILGNEGGDPTRTLDQQTKDFDARLQGSTRRLVPAMQATVRFLRDEAGIPHRRLLPYRAPLVVLPTFFARHPDPSPRTRALLRRWVWRGLMSGVHQDSQKTRLRAAVKAASRETEEDAAHRLLDLVPDRPVEWTLPRDRTYDARPAVHRIGLLGLASLSPLDASTDDPVALAALLCEAGSDSVRKLYTGDTTTGLDDTLANRVLHPKRDSLRMAFVHRVRELGPDDPLLASHAFTPEAAAALAEGDMARCLEVRATTIERVVHALAASRAEWGADDSTSVRGLLRRLAS